jgi:phosphatidylinositol alpha-mannosyltransferase
VRIAVVSPYSWTYPGGVTRHIEALSGALRTAGHDVSVLAPFDPDDRLSLRLHRGARPQARPMPDDFVSLGRTFGFQMNGAVSNVCVSPAAVMALREELRTGRYDVVHLQEPGTPVVCWDALGVTRAPLVGTYHTYSTNTLTNGAAALLGARRRMNRLHVRVAVSEAAAWTAQRYFGGRYRIIPNGVDLVSLGPPAAPAAIGPDRPLRIVFVGQAVGRKGLPHLLRAFEALRDHVPAELTLVGAGPDDVANLMLDDRDVRILGKVSDADKVAELCRADVLCAPSLSGESFGMVLTEAFAAGTPVVASDIAGYRDVVRDGVDGLLVPRADPVALADALRALALDDGRRAGMAAEARARAERFAWPRVASEVLEAYEDARAMPTGAPALTRFALDHGFVPADRQPSAPPVRLPSLEPAPLAVGGGTAKRLLRRVALVGASAAAGALGFVAVQRIGLPQIVASLLSSRPSFLLIGLGLMAAAMAARGVAWHLILRTTPGLRHARLADAWQGTFIGVLMSATLPARLGEPSRAVIVARRLGRARETLPVVTGTIVSQALMNMLALAVLGAVMFSSVDVLDGHHGVLLAIAIAPAAALLTMLVAPALDPWASSRRARVALLRNRLRGAAGRLRDGASIVRRPKVAAAATGMQLGAWTLQWMSCFFLLVAFGVGHHVGLEAAAGVLFAVNATAVIPATPSNIGVFQAACVAVLHGAFHVAIPAALAFGIILQAVELTIALVMGGSALVTEGLSWRDVRQRTLHATPVTLEPLGAGDGGAPAAAAKP